MNEGTSSTSATISQTEEQVILRLELPPQELAVHWDEKVVDNENMNKKKSNKCCIYHKPKAYDESDSESDHSDDEEVKFREMYPDYAGKPSGKGTHKCTHHNHD